MVFQAVEVLIPLATHFTSVGLLFLHAEGSGVRSRRFGVHNRKGTVSVVVQLLAVMAMLNRC